MTRGPRGDTKPAMEKILVSACLVGQRVRYDGRDADPHEALLARWQAEGRLVPICPEVAGGLPVPRPPAELVAGRVLTRPGEDVTAAFTSGAQAALALAKRHGIRLAVLKAKSPSCGSAGIYDGTFTGRVVPGEGVTAALLRAHGIEVFSELELAQVERRLAVFEARQGEL